MKKSIVMTTFKRPDYLSQVLESLSKNSGLDNYTLYFACEPGYPEVVKVCQSVDFMKRVITVNPKNLGVRDNPYAALKRAFDMGSEAVVYMEDDVIVSQDFIKLFEYYLTLPNVDDYLCLNFYNPDSDPARPNEVVKKKDFNALCAGITKAQWDKFFFKAFHRDWRGWDFGPTALLNENPNLFTIQPALSRSAHIGRLNGVHYLPKEHDPIYHNKPWHQNKSVEEFKIV